jgi:hypothetical protein
MTTKSMHRVPLVSRTIGKLGLALVFLGCSTDSLTLPGEGAPAHIQIVDGDDQQGVAGQPLADSLIVMISDEANRPVAGRVVSLATSGGGSANPSQVTTDEEGMASFRWVLGPSAGGQSLVVGLGTAGPQVTFIATAQAGPVSLISAVSGDGQTGQAGSPLTLPLVVRLVDSFGNGVAGADVFWQASDGRLNKGMTTTSSDGSTSVTWTLGSGSGIQTATARFQGAEGSPITFNATALQSSSPRLHLITEPSSTAQSGEEFAQQPSVRLEDSQGQPLRVSGIAVTVAIATGGGILGGNTTLSTNSLGVVNFTDLSISGNSGQRTLIFAADGHTSTTSTPIDVTGSAPSGPSPQYSTASVPNGKRFQWTKITIITRDASGNDLDQGGYGDLIEVTVTGANNANPTVFDEDDGTYEAFYFPVNNGNDDIEITINGLPIQGSPYRSKVK